jgi:ring-1,2-phenylacetyl-CoA epoxidase subunit PaaC
VSERAQRLRLLPIADDELILGWRESEWTGIAPDLEEDVAFSSIAQNEVGHARALYALIAEELATTPDELAFDRAPAEYRSAPLVELRLPDWGDTIARRALYELADEVRLATLVDDPDPDVAGIARKIDREEAYHRLHAEMWVVRLLASAEGRSRLEASVRRLWPLALGVLEGDQREQLAERAQERLGFALEPPEPVGRDGRSDEFEALWEEMTMVRRSVPGARW